MRRAKPLPWAVSLWLLIGCEGVVLNFNTPGPPAPEPTEPRGEADAGGAPEPLPSPELVLRSDWDLSAQNYGARECGDGGDAVAYSTVAARAGRLVLEAAPGSGCLSPGDEVLLIQLQGSDDALERVGRHELLRIQAVHGTEVELVAPPINAYGDGAHRMWTAPPGQVFLQRVPSYTRLSVHRGATLTASAWGAGGTGVLALRVLGDAQVDGTITMNGRGYQGGSERTEALADGLAGESIGGLGADSRAPNDGGGGGGLGDQERGGCVQDGTAGGGGAHLEDGEDARVPACDGEGRGRGGRAYAAEGKLFLGSGGGSGGVDNVRSDNPPGAPGGRGGGIVWILAQSVSGSGKVEARGEEGVGDEPGFECLAGASRTKCYDHSGTGGGGAGGSIRLDAPQVSGVTLDVEGGEGGNGHDSAGGDGGAGSDGVIVGPALPL